MEEEKEKELKAEEEEDEDSTGWTLAHDSDGRQHFCHRRTRRTAWELPESAILRMRKMRKKRKKKKLPRGSSLSRSSRVRIWRCGHGRALVLRGFLMCSSPYCSCGRARRRLWQWHMLGWFGWLLLALCSLLSFTDARHHGRYEPEGQFRGEYGSDCRKLDFPQLQFIMVVDFSFATLRLIPMVLATMKIPPVVRGKGGQCPYFAGADFPSWCRG